MDAERDLTQAGDWLRPFPDAAEVFAADQQHLARHLHPLVSIDLAAVDPHGSGWLHLLSPLEPCDGLVGQYSQVEDGELLKPNWIGFQVEADGRYRLLGDARYFLLESSAEQTPAALALSRRDLEKHYAEQEAAYAASRDYYRRNGKLVRLDRKGRPSYGDEDAVELVESVGGEVDAGEPRRPALPPRRLGAGLELPHQRRRYHLAVLRTGRTAGVAELRLDLIRPAAAA